MKTLEYKWGKILLGLTMFFWVILNFVAFLLHCSFCCCIVSSNLFSSCFNVPLFCYSLTTPLFCNSLAFLFRHFITPYCIATLGTFLTYTFCYVNHLLHYTLLHHHFRYFINLRFLFCYSLNSLFFCFTILGLAIFLVQINTSPFPISLIGVRSQFNL